MGSTGNTVQVTPMSSEGYNMGSTGDTVQVTPMSSQGYSMGSALTPKSNTGYGRLSFKARAARAARAI